MDEHFSVNGRLWQSVFYYVVAKNGQVFLDQVVSSSKFLLPLTRLK